MSDEKPTCPACGSPDTISYWDRKPPVDAAKNALVTVEYIYRHCYPNARLCVDCEHVWGR